MLLSVFVLLRQWNVTALYPDDPVRILCFELGDDAIDTRIIREKTDRVQLCVRDIIWLHIFHYFG